MHSKCFKTFLNVLGSGIGAVGYCCKWDFGLSLDPAIWIGSVQKRGHLAVNVTGRVRKLETGSKMA